MERALDTHPQALGASPSFSTFRVTMDTGRSWTVRPVTHSQLQGSRLFRLHCEWLLRACCEQLRFSEPWFPQPDRMGGALASTLPVCRLKVDTVIGCSDGDGDEHGDWEGGRAPGSGAPYPRLVAPAPPPAARPFAPWPAAQSCLALQGWPSPGPQLLL